MCASFTWFWHVFGNKQASTTSAGAQVTRLYACFEHIIEPTPDVRPLTLRSV